MWDWRGPGPGPGRVLTVIQVVVCEGEILQWSDCLVGLFGKAKRKLLGKEMEAGLTYVAPGSVGLSTVGDTLSSAAVGGIDPALWEPQELGENSSARNHLH